MQQDLPNGGPERSIGREFLRFRVDFAKISQEELARLAGVPVGVVEKVETGDFDGVGMLDFMALCWFCGKLDRLAKALSSDIEVERRWTWEFQLTDAGESLDAHPFDWRQNIGDHGDQA